MIAVCPIDFEIANDFVGRLHRHHKPMPGCKFVVGITDGIDLRGVAIAGRPVSRRLDDGFTVEVNRCCTGGVKNGCSMLYGACARTARAMGYSRIITYTLPDEGGASLKASGWRCEGNAGGGAWIRNDGLRNNTHPLESKWRWELILSTVELPDWRAWKNSPVELTPLFGD